LSTEVFEVQSAFHQGIGDFVPTNKRDSLLILFTTFPKELSDEILHFPKNANRSQQNRELKNWKTAENSLDEHWFASMVEPRETPGLDLELEFF
jgi:hypothetical protein